MFQTSSGDTAIVAELRLQDRLTALRNVRPGTRLARLKGGLPRGLLQEVLGLPEGVNALQWLAAERSDAVALLTLQMCLSRAATLHGYHSRIDSKRLSPEAKEKMRQDTQRKYGVLYGGLLAAEAGWSAPKQAFDTVADPSAQQRLQESLRELRRQSGLLTEATPAWSRADPEQDALVADLLRLPDTTDPAQWLQAHRPALCARFTLQDILLQAIPMETVDNLLDSAHRGSKAGVLHRVPLPRSLGPEAQTDVSERLHVSVTRIDVLEHGFVVRAQCRFGVPPGWSHVKRPEGWSFWEGFRIARDSAGHHYVVFTGFPMRFPNSPWWEGEIVNICWPALGEARELILESQPAYLTVHRMPREGDLLIPVPGPSLGNARCTFALGA